jgi:1-acyl-sn-glycerol-3-phosphate acyltransferase
MMSAVLFHWFSRIYFRLEIRGRENLPKDKSFVIASNHVSLLDFPLLFSCLPVTKIQDVIAPAAQDYFYSSFLRRNLVQLAFNTFAFERFGNFVKGLKICGELIKKGKTIILFPEGTRATENALMPFKPGIGSLAWELAVPVIPTYIHGAFEAFPKGSIFPKPTKIIVTFGEAVYANKRGDENICSYDNYLMIAKAVEDKVRELKDGIIKNRDGTGHKS